ncbi:MAG: VanZ family protein [Saprospiraceae bacterium]|nr:VanZ family protein [Saprospiraceae bacterium]
MILIKFIFKNWYFIAATWIVADIILLSLAPSNSFSNLNLNNLFSIDKLGHLLFYGSSTFLYLHAFKSNEKAKKYTVVVIFTLGLLLEFFQLKMNMGRAFEYLDVVANCFGILLSILIFNKVKNKKLQN